MAGYTIFEHLHLHKKPFCTHNIRQWAEPFWKISPFSKSCRRVNRNQLIPYCYHHQMLPFLWCFKSFLCLTNLLTYSLVLIYDYYLLPHFIITCWIFFWTLNNLLFGQWYTLLLYEHSSWIIIFSVLCQLKPYFQDKIHCSHTDSIIISSLLWICFELPVFFALETSFRLCEHHFWKFTAAWVSYDEFSYPWMSQSPSLVLPVWNI